MDSAPAVAPPARGSRGRTLLRLFWEWLKISAFVVGGGYAIIVVADTVFGRKLKWLREGELIDHLPIFQTIPGLIAGNSAIYVGRKVAGLSGAFVALCGVALPSFVIILAVAHGFSWLPVENAHVQGAFIGLRGALAGLVLATVVKSWRRVVHGFYPWAMVAASFLLLEAAHANPAHVLLGAMFCGIAWFLVAPASRLPPQTALAADSGPASTAGGGRRLAAAAVAVLLAVALLHALLPALARIYLVFAKFGALCFGGGYVLMPFYLQAFVEHDALVTLEEFGNLLAITQATPGPVSVNAATFFGFYLGGALCIPCGGTVGSLFATLGLLTPSFFLLLFALLSLDRFHGSRLVRGLLWGVAPATIGLMLSALLVFLELSVFSEGIPWRALFDSLFGATGGASMPEGFRFRPVALLLVAGITWAFLRTKVSVVALILASAVFGAVAFPFLGG